MTSDDNDDSVNERLKMYNIICICNTFDNTRTLGLYTRDVFVYP